MLAKNRTGVDAINTVSDAREISKRKLPKMVWDFIDGGADGELSIVANRRSLNEIKLRPKFLTDVSNRDISAKIFGERAELPFILSPSGMATIAHPHGELAVAKAADRAGAIFCVSTASGYTLEEIASVSNGRLWFQLYLWGNEEVVNSLIDRAGVSGYEALVVTVDVPVAEAQSVLTVHKDAVIRRGKNPSVMVARASDEAGLYQAESRTLRLGPAIGGRFVVLSGVGPGDIVVVRGNEGLRPGQPFKLAGDEAAGPPEGRKP